MTIPRLPPELLRFADTDADWLARLQDFCVAAHTAAPGGATLEIGTRSGGSAYALALALAALYPGGAHQPGPPPLLTCDPYGNRPYHDGRARWAETDYGPSRYVEMRRLLADVPFHWHVRLTSAECLASLGDWTWWEQGVARRLDDMTFAFLDGEHDAATIELEVTRLWPMLRPGGVIVVDNVQHDPRTLPLLMAHDGFSEHIAPGWVVLRKAPA